MTKAHLPLSEAMAMAEKLITELEPVCERIEIAGSIRRRKPFVGDVELVCIPKIEPQLDMFGLQVGSKSMLEEQLAWMPKLKDGPSYKQLDLGPCNLDLFITTREKWGLIFTLRTGSSEFSHWLVTHRRYGGALPSNLTINEGRIWRESQLLETPEEKDIFKTIGLAWVDPQHRTGPKRANLGTLGAAA